LAEKIDISVVIPLLNEEESLPELSAWIDRVMDAHKYTYEILFIDDGSKDTSWEVIEKLSKENSSIKGIKFQRNYGKSAALQKGLKLLLAVWLLPWMLIFRILPMRFQNCIE
jgi:glycosyltransferase involved in cell wall biosynthesis